MDRRSHIGMFWSLFTLTFDFHSSAISIYGSFLLGNFYILLKIIYFDNDRSNKMIVFVISVTFVQEYLSILPPCQEYNILFRWSLDFWLFIDDLRQFGSVGRCQHDLLKLKNRLRLLLQALNYYPLWFGALTSPFPPQSLTSSISHKQHNFLNITHSYSKSENSSRPLNSSHWPNTSFSQPQVGFGWCSQRKLFLSDEDLGTSSYLYILGQFYP